MRPETHNLTMLAIELQTLALRVARRFANNDSAIRPQDAAGLKPDFFHHAGKVHHMVHGDTGTARDLGFGRGAHED